jgi:hypothetical protein
MYKLGAPTVCLDDSVIKIFVHKEVEGEEIQMVDLIRELWHDPNSFKII